MRTGFDERKKRDRNWQRRCQCVKRCKRLRTTLRAGEGALIAAARTAIHRALTAVSNVHSAMQVCTQPQICGERPYWEPRPYLTRGEFPSLVLLSLPCTLFPSLLSAYKKRGLPHREGSVKQSWSRVENCEIKK